MSGGTCEGVNSEDPKEEDRLPAARTALAAGMRAVAISAIPSRGDVARVGDVHQHPGEELQRVHNLSARRRAVRLVRSIRRRRGGAVLRQRYKRLRIPRTIFGELSGSCAVHHGHAEGGVDVEPRVGSGSMRAARLRWVMRSEGADAVAGTDGARTAHGRRADGARTAQVG